MVVCGPTLVDASDVVEKGSGGGSVETTPAGDVPLFPEPFFPVSRFIDRL